MFSFFKKNSSEEKDKNNWYADRYQNAVVQRNFLGLIALIALIGILFSILTVIKISSSQTIKPFVIEVEEKTGITNVIRPLLKEQFSYSETLKRYFLTKYINSRETYDYNSYRYNFFTVVRLYSSPSVYSSFRSSVRQSSSNSPLRLADKGDRLIKIKSIAFLKPDTAQIRFVSYDSFSGNKRDEKHLMATISFQYIDMSLNNEERAINPLGFQVTNYRIDQDVVR